MTGNGFFHQLLQGVVHQRGLAGQRAASGSKVGWLMASDSA
jgi:hypothetical protein